MKQATRGLAIALSLLAGCSGTINGGGGGGGDGGDNGGGDKPVIESFTATPSTLAAEGGSVQLSWSVSDADTLVIDPGVGSVTGSSIDVEVTRTTVFTLSASNEAGTTTRSALVSVGAGPDAPVIFSFTATPATLPKAGGTTTLAWSVQGATSLSIDNGVGTVSGESTSVKVDATTVFTLTATNDEGSATSTTAVVVGQNPSSRGGRFSAMVSPTAGENFVAPASLRLVAVGRDPNVATNEPTGGLGGNASKVQFFVDDQIVFELDGLDAEYWVFKGFAHGVTQGTHLVWARSIYVDPPDVLDSPPAIVTVGAPPTYAQTVELSADLTVGSGGYELVGSPGARIRLNGNGHQIVSSGQSGPLTLRFVDVFDLGDRADTSQAAIQVQTGGAVTIEDSIFDGSNPIRVTGGGAMSIRRNLFRSNMRMPIGQGPDPYDQSTYPVAEFTGNGSGARVFAGNNVGASYVTFAGSGWVVGGEADADENVLIGPRVGLQATGSAQFRRNYSHHVYYGGWSQGNNFELGGGGGTVEHNVISGSSWPVRGVAGEFRYNLVLNAGHQWLWADNDGASVHHNVFIGGEADVGGIYVLYNPKNVQVFNNTIDGQGDIDRAIYVQEGSISLTSNLILRAPGPAVLGADNLASADYNLFFGPMPAYSDGRTPANDKIGVDPELEDPIADVPFDLDEAGIWKRTITVRDILGVFRTRYAPQAGSPVIDAGDPAGGAGNDIGAIGAGAENAADFFGRL